MWLGFGGESMDNTVVVPAVVPADEHVDVHTTKRAALQREQQEDVRRPLAEFRREWQHWLPLAEDPTGRQELNRLAPLITALENRDKALSQEIAKEEATIVRNRAQAQAAAVLVTETRTRLDPMRSRLQLTDAEIEWAWKTSRELDHEHRELLASTGDRRYRRPPCDPYRALVEQAEATLTALHRIRAVRSQVQLGKLATTKETA
jgi:hypothetical protein